MAATALTGQALGAGKPDRARRATWFATRSAMLWMGSVGLLFLVAAEPMVRLFTDDPEILAAGSLAMRVLALGQVQMALGLVLTGGLRGAGDTRFPMLLVSASMWLVRLPVAWVAVEILGWGPPGAYLAFVAGSTIESAVVYWRYRAGKWQFLKV
jgi:Na+-driven multidrug efflux pump